ncbi:MAG: hypothetical protein RLZ25_2227 [Pseudomonadota bacterium]
MKTEISLINETQTLAPRHLLNNPVADSWQTRLALPVAAERPETEQQDPLDLVGHTLNGRPIYRAWQLALLLGISPAVLSSSLGTIPTNLRPFEILDEDHEAIAGRSAVGVVAISRGNGLEQKSRPMTAVGDLRRLAVLARTTESFGLTEISDERWNQLIGTFKEF